MGVYIRETNNTYLETFCFSEFETNNSKWQKVKYFFVCLIWDGCQNFKVLRVEVLSTDC